jgi:hypothetical protein
MNVAQLIEQLQYMPQDAEVHFEYGFGDYWRTTVAPKVSQVGMGRVEYSSYHQMDKVIEPKYDDEDEDQREADSREVVLIG